jgi:hypothetical protein
MTIKNVELNGTCIDVILLANPHGTPYKLLQELFVHLTITTGRMREGRTIWKWHCRFISKQSVILTMTSRFFLLAKYGVSCVLNLLPVLTRPVRPCLTLQWPTTLLHSRTRCTVHYHRLHVALWTDHHHLPFREIGHCWPVLVAFIQWSALISCAPWCILLQ